MKTESSSSAAMEICPLESGG